MTSGHDEPIRPKMEQVIQSRYIFICSNLAPFNDHLRLTSVLSVKHRGAEEFSQKPKVMAIKTVLWILSGETHFYLKVDKKADRS